eukprot:2597438-Rhodomonas_salina.1
MHVGCFTLMTVSRSLVSVSAARLAVSFSVWELPKTVSLAEEVTRGSSCPAHAQISDCGMLAHRRERKRRPTRLMVSSRSSISTRAESWSGSCVEHFA